MSMLYFERLKEEMSYQDITQKELSEKTNIPLNTLRGWFSKKILPDLTSAYKMAQELNQPLEYFINGDIFPPNNYHLPTREIKLLENYRKLSQKEKNSVDALVKSLSSEYKENIQEDIF